MAASAQFLVSLGIDPEVRAFGEDAFVVKLSEKRGIITPCATDKFTEQFYAINEDFDLTIIADFSENRKHNRDAEDLYSMLPARASLHRLTESLQKRYLQHCKELTLNFNAVSSKSHFARIIQYIFRYKKGRLEELNLYLTFENDIVLAEINEVLGKETVRFNNVITSLRLEKKGEGYYVLQTAEGEDVFKTTPPSEEATKALIKIQKAALAHFENSQKMQEAKKQAEQSQQQNTLYDSDSDSDSDDDDTQEATKALIEIQKAALAHFENSRKMQEAIKQADQSQQQNMAYDSDSDSDDDDTHIIQKTKDFLMRISHPYAWMVLTAIIGSLIPILNKYAFDDDNPFNNEKPEWLMVAGASLLFIAFLNSRYQLSMATKSSHRSNKRSTYLGYAWYFLPVMSIGAVTMLVGAAWALGDADYAGMNDKATKGVFTMLYSAMGLSSAVLGARMGYTANILRKSLD